MIIKSAVDSYSSWRLRARVKGRLDPFTDLCTPGMGVNLWGESPLCVNPVNVVRHGHKH